MLVAMSTLDAFDQLARDRRTSLKVVADETVPAELVQRLIEVATLAPNHKRTWPWRFAVLTGSARDRLGVLVSDFEARRGADAARVSKALGKYRRAPVVVLVGATAEPDPVR